MIYLALSILVLLSLSGLFLKHARVSGYINSDFVALGAGAMIAVALVHIFPESIEVNSYAPFAFIGGFLTIYLLENFLIIHTCMEDHCHYHHVSWMSWVTLFIHTIFDGIGIAAAFLLSPELGYTVLAGVAIHQIPVSFSLALLFRESDFSPRVQTLFMGAFALAIPLGFFMSSTLLGDIGNTHLTALLMAVSGGSLLYIAASDLLPVIHKKNNNRGIVVILFLIGAIGVSLGRFVG
ncbi:MAG: ZIP family metal transporter [Candidatus Gracilibacteria bacterium]|nr:ZIP family metal transporter [Candidatus Gracilibacteria bacterium]